MEWLVLLCFAFFAIGLFGFMFNMFKGKSLWTQSSSFSPDQFLPEDDDEYDDEDKN